MRRKFLNDPWVISLISPFVVIGISSLLDKFVAAFKETACLWIFSVSVLVYGASVAWVYYYQARKRGPLAFLLLSNAPSKSFFGSLTHQLLVQFDNKDYFVSVSTPALLLDAESQQNQFKKIIQNRDMFLGGIVIPVEPRANKKAIKDFVLRFDRPVVFIDAQFIEGDENYQENMAYVGYDNAVGGALAAKAMLEELKRVKKANEYKILVIGAEISSERHKSFIDELNKEKEKFEFKTITFPFHDREKAKSQLLGIINDLGAVAEGGQSEFPHDGIFCTNDDMALGVVECLKAQEKNHGKFNVVVIGYDAISEARSLIDRGDNYLKDTINQDVEELAKEATSVLFTLIEGGEVKNKIKKLAPSIYKGR